MIVTPPKKTIGILGGGQLGRMLALAAARLGYRCHVYAPEAECPAFDVAAASTIAAYEDAGELRAFGEAVDVVTYEFENVPVQAVERLSRHVPVFPDAGALAITQDRLKEKDFVTSAGGRTAPYACVDDAEDAHRAALTLGLPLVLKTRRFGYDGKGQVMVREKAELEAALRKLGGRDLIAESFVAFEREISVVLARGQDGALACYPAVENRHRNHILDETIAPADIPSGLAARAEEMARGVAEKLGYVGVLAVEMFVVDGEVLVNELAPRVHNSGHWTIDACATSQFEQHVRAICGLPLGDTRPLCRAVMKNLIGDEIAQWRKLLSEPALRFHDYGKLESRPGRKMGHVTRLYPFEK